MNRWVKLFNYLMDGILEIDNNVIENMMRPIALGRKNYLFAASREAAQRAVML
ncbi:transposase [Rhodonellum sp.]|uniref:IS66 family transposase n=1 Tax=Rhodonellum sp. TaxID=2231180 RepID=UPI00271E8372|nr:transposase [Rhodonellum sp.]MDO9554616.1 transposase [Rhodonellum sp.]